MSTCPKGCIQMVPKHLGHLFPRIDTHKCISCGLCERICKLNLKIPLSPIQSVYASWSKNEYEYKSSASGGIASELSKFVIMNGGVVYGCAMLPDIEVRHIRVDCLADLAKLKSSKYVQSSISGIVSPLKEDLSMGKMVLFIGTPCQVSAIKSLFLSPPKLLFCIDLICHGVPSQVFLKKYIHRVTKGKKCTNVSFRDGDKYILRAWDDHLLLFESYLRSPRYSSMYLDAFMDGYTYRESCYHCTFAGPNRVGDITIGDFWGLGKTHSINELADHPYGCSAVFPITPKGELLLNGIKDRVYLYQREVSEAISGNRQLRHPMRKNRRISIYRQLQRFLLWPEFYRLVNLDRILANLWKEK